MHAVCDALRNPTQFYLTPGQVHDFSGADALLTDVEAKYCEVVIPPTSRRNQPRDYDQHLYKSRHLIENFFARIKQYRAIAKRYDKRAINFLGAMYLAASVI